VPKGNKSAVPQLQQSRNTGTVTSGEFFPRAGMQKSKTLDKKSGKAG